MSGDEAETPDATRTRVVLQRLRRSPGGLVGLGIVVCILLATLLGPLLAQDPAMQSLSGRFAVPGLFGGDPRHPLGADNFGRDVLARVLSGARVSLAVSVSVVILSMGIGTLVGILAGYVGGMLDGVLMRVADFQLSIPFILIALVLMAVLGPGVSTLVIALTAAFWVRFARVLRGEVLKIASLEYVQAAAVTGVGQGRIILRHVLPNVLPLVIVLVTLDLALAIIAEASLSFLGLGVPPPTPSWGMMISEGRGYLTEAPWITLAPAAAVMLTTVGVNLLGDFLRDALDTRLEER